jgi:hypothetical protein
LNEIKLIEQYLLKQLPAAEEDAVRRRIDSDQAFRLNIFLQRKLYQVLQLHQSFLIRKQASDFHERLFRDPERGNYTKRIHQLFQ